MASTSELQKVRAKIEELEKEVKDLKVQIAASARPALQQELNLQLSRLAELEKQKTLLLQKSVGKLQWWSKKLMAVLPTAAALGISERLAFTNLPWGVQYLVALLCDAVLRLALKFIVTEVHKRFTARRRNSVAAA